NGQNSENNERDAHLPSLHEHRGPLRGETARPAAAHQWRLQRRHCGHRTKTGGPNRRGGHHPRRVTPSYVLQDHAPTRCRSLWELGADGANTWRQFRFCCDRTAPTCYTLPWVTCPGVSPMRRREFITWLGGALTSWPIPANAQRAARVRTVGVMMGLADDAEARSRAMAFEQG